MINQPPDYILAKPNEEDVPLIMASCDKQDIDKMKELCIPGMYIYKLVKKI